MSGHVEENLLDKHNSDEFIALIPAAGLDKRLQIKDCSKEVLPVSNGNGSKKVVSDFLLSAYRTAGINSVYIIIRDGKWDIPQCFSGGSSRGLSIAYLMLECPWGTPYTLDQAWPFVKDKNIALGFPDIILQPQTAFIDLKRKLTTTQCDVVLGLFKTNNPTKADMVKIDESGRVIKLDIKPADSNLTYTWVIAVWRPSFTRYMHNYLQKERPFFEFDNHRSEPYVGTVINAAIANGMLVDTVVFEDGFILDIGTPADLHIAQSNDFSGGKPNQK